MQKASLKEFFLEDRSSEVWQIIEGWSVVLDRAKGWDALTNKVLAANT
jgi:hypothetical protein